MKRFKVLLSLILIATLISGCGRVSKEFGTDKESQSNSKHLVINEFKGESLKIASGSENAVFNDLIEEYARKNKQNIEIDYIGSLDQMNIIRDPNTDYDAVWPASTIWLNMANDKKIVKYDEITSISPVVFGIKESKAKELGFYGKEVSTKDILNAIESGNLKFTMTSATQSNSGASAYLAFLTALNSETLTSEDLDKPELKSEIISLLSGVERSSGSSNFLVDLFINGNYDAMVNYEQLIIQTNEKLAEQDKEPLYMIYPSDGLSISDSTLAYLDHEDSEKEEMFLNFEEYILSDETQSKIEKTGKRNKNGTVLDENKEVFKKWGADLDKTLNTIRYPKSEVIEKALNLYQTEFKKPSFTVYVLDYSSSMRGKGYDQMVEALGEVLIPENANKNLLLGNSEDITYIVPFSTEVIDIAEGRGNSTELQSLYDKVLEYNVSGATSLYEATLEAVDLVDKNCNLATHQPSIILLSDGAANGAMGINDLEEKLGEVNKDIPIFSIKFGSSDDEEIKKIAELTNAKVFDGRSDLIKAFKEVRGYN